MEGNKREWYSIWTGAFTFALEQGVKYFVY